MNMACVSVSVSVSVGIAIPKASLIQPNSWKSEAIATRSNLRIAKSSKSSSRGGGVEEDEDKKLIKFEGTRRREKELTEMIQKKIREAEKVCSEDKTSDGCKVAWDEVEEISAAKSHLRLQLMHSGDPLESFCQQHPETEECRIYHD